MDPKQRYLTFVENEIRLPENIKIDPNTFFDELCGIDADKLEKAIRWMTVQEGFEVAGLSGSFIIKYMNTANPDAYLVIAKCCNNLLEDFEKEIEHRIMELMKYLYSKCEEEKGFIKLFRAMDRVNRVYEQGMLSWKVMNYILCQLMNRDLTNSQRIATLKVMLGRGVAQNLKKELVDQRFLAYLDMMKTTIEFGENCGTLTVAEIEEVTSALVNIKLFSASALSYEKIDDVYSYVDGWCYDCYNLKETLDGFSASKIQFSEEFDSIFNRISFLAMIERQFQEKLAIMYAHLQNEVFKDQKEFNRVLICHVNERCTRPSIWAEDVPECDLAFDTFVSHLYKNDVFKHCLIINLLEYLMKMPPKHGEPRFASLFPKIEDKLKAGISGNKFRIFQDHMMQKIVRGNNKTPPVNHARGEWLKKVVEDRKIEANRSRRQQALKEVKNIEPNDIKDAIEGYCEGVYSFQKTLRWFETSENLSVIAINAIAKECFENAMSKPQYSEQLVDFLRNLVMISKGYFRTCLNAVLQDFLLKHLQHTSELNMERNLHFALLLEQFFANNVIDKALIVKCLDLFKKDRSKAARKCFTEMFAKVHEKLKMDMGAGEYFYLECFMANDTGTQPAPRKNVKKFARKPRSKKQIAPRPQLMTISIQVLENQEELDEVVEKLRNVLNSDGRMRIFVKHILERRETDLKDILLHAKLLSSLAKASEEGFEFKECLLNAISTEFNRTTSTVNFDEKARNKLNRIEIISGELWRNHLMATKKFAGLLMNKNMRRLPTESLAHLSMIVGREIHSEGNSRLKLAVRQFEPFIHESTLKGWSDMKSDLEDVGAELQTLLSYEESLAVSQQ